LLVVSPSLRIETVSQGPTGLCQVLTLGNGGNGRSVLCLVDALEAVGVVKRENGICRSLDTAVDTGVDEPESVDVEFDSWRRDVSGSNELVLRLEVAGKGRAVVTTV
jgi:hypothetical protein